jgi:hypothetical protein
LEEVDSDSGPYDVYHEFDWPDVGTNQPIDPLEMGREYFHIEGDKPGKSARYNIDHLSLEHRLVLEWICLNVLPSGGHACEPSIGNIMIFYYLVKGLRINPGHTIYEYMVKCSNHPKKRFPYGCLITEMMRKKGIVPVEMPIANKYYDKDWLKAKELVLDLDTYKYKVKPPSPGKTAKAAKRKRDTSASSSNAARK